MKELRKWAKDKPYIIKIAAAHMVSAIETLSDEIRTLKHRRFTSQKFPQPPLHSWFAMYRSHRKVNQIIKDVLGAVYGRNIVQLFSGQFEKARNSRNVQVTYTQEEIKEAINSLELIYSASEKELEDEFNQVPLKQSAQRRLNKLIAEKPLELSFYFFVAVPCWALYRMTPTHLYRMARQDNDEGESLVKLLRLDQIMLHDPVIGKKMIWYRFNHLHNTYKKLLRASTEPPKGSNSLKNILLSQLGLISALSYITPTPLTPQKLLELVAAYDHDTKSNFLEELSESPDSLARSLSPDRNLWRQLIHSDKKK